MSNIERAIRERTHGDPPDRASLPGSDDKWEGYQLGVEEASAIAAELLRGAVSLTAEELHCLTCAMAGNFPEQFAPIRMDLLRKLARASHDLGGR